MMTKGLQEEMSQHEGPHQHHDVQICHLVNSSFTQDDDGACGVQAPPARSARHLNILA